MKKRKLSREAQEMVIKLVRVRGSQPIARLIGVAWITLEKMAYGFEVSADSADLVEAWLRR